VSVRPTRRAWAVAALLVVGALDLHTTAVGLRAHARLRERTLSGLSQATVQARPRLAALAAPGGPDAAQRTAVAAVEAGLGSTAEVFRMDGTPMASAPEGAASRHWPLDRDLLRLRRGEVVTTTQLAGVPPRVFAYVLLPTRGVPMVLRLGADAADLVADLRDRQETFVTQALGLLLVLATMALVAPPRAETPAADASPGLVAYEEAMVRLRARDAEMARQHLDERRRMEGELRDNAPFVRAGELTVGIVHEIRNGLGTILGYARLVEAAGGPAADHARGIVEECETLEAVVRRFMEFVKDDSLHASTFDLGRMLTRVAARESKGRPGPETVLPRGSVGMIEADEDLLERAFENLVRNARDAAGPSGHVWVDVERGRDVVLVSVSDDGPGMAPEVRSSLRPFFTTKSGGLGLGLPLAYKIVRQHGGDLMLGERPPRGLAVRVRLPLSRSTADAVVTDGNLPTPPVGVRDATPLDES
jgi:signal transduction histidine kinase